MRRRTVGTRSVVPLYPNTENFTEGEESVDILECRDERQGFLRDGNVRHFWMRRIGLPNGVSGDLAELAQKIKNVGKERARGMILSIWALTNRLTPSQLRLLQAS